VWPAFVAFGLLMGWQFIVSSLLILALALFEYGAAFEVQDIFAVAESAPGLFIGTVGTLVVAAGLALAGAWLSPQPWRARLRLRLVPMRLPVLLAATLGILSAGTLFTALIELGVLPRVHVFELLQRLLRGLSPAGVALAVVLLGLLPGFAEELFFRGYIQTRLVARWGAGRGIGWTALLFGCAHLHPVHGAFAAIVGALLGFLTVRTGSVVPAMICHALSNTLSLTLALATPDHLRLPVSILLLGASLFALPTVVLYLRARLPPAAVAGRDGPLAAGE